MKPHQCGAIALTYAIFLLSDAQVQGFSPSVPSRTLLTSGKYEYTKIYMSSINKENGQKVQAGEDGYSLLRQPISWDAETVPKFDTPTALNEADEGKNVDNQKWFQERIVGNKSFQTKAKANQEETKEGEDNAGSDSSFLEYEMKQAEMQRGIDLYKRSFEVLDYKAILNALESQCNTAPARKIVNKAKLRGADEEKGESKKKKGVKQDDILSMGLTAHDVDGIHERYNAIREMKEILNRNVQAEVDNNEDEKNDWKNNNKKKKKSKKQMKIVSGPPISGSDFDISPMWEKINNGGVLDGPDILEVETILKACKSVFDWCHKLEEAELIANPLYIEGSKGDEEVQNGESHSSNPSKKTQHFQYLPKYGRSIFIDDDLLELLESAFDNKGRLSGRTFPEIGRLRAKVRTLQGDILSTLDTLLSSPSVKNKVSMESGGALYSEVNGRIVIPIDKKYSSSVGIIHDQSRSGKTSYVEPSEIVRPTNEMNQALMELKQEENRVWRMLTKSILDAEEDINRSIISVAQLDLVLARIRLGDVMEGVIPSHVGEDGIISLRNVKHPVLLLRKGLKGVVGSDIELGTEKNRALILSGPNAGGKTITEKTIGLCALMSRDGLLLPAEEGARVDFFNPVLADIGDLQSVDEDLSTFSGHMLVCREVLANSGKNALVLMDELGSGTDPNQGVAIAQAILEALLDNGSRVVITTHYMQLKQLAASDDRFAIGAMQFINGKPTYKFLPGVVGESFALSVAERLNLPQYVIDRASELMDSETKQMGDLISSLEDQKVVIDEQAQQLEQKKKDLERIEEEMKKQQQKLEREQLTARRKEAEKFAKKLEEKERILEEVLQNLKSDPSKKLIAKSWDEIRYVRRDALTEAENVPSVLRKKAKAAAAAEEQFSDMVPLSEMREKPDLQAGDTLVICKKGPLAGKEATVVNSSGKKVNVSVQGMQMSMKLAELSMPTKSFNAKKAATQQMEADAKNKMSKMARKALEMEPSEISTGQGDKNSKSGGSMMRLSSNTVDCLGLSFEEARRKCEDKFSKVMMSKHPVVYILHGHGTKGVLKQKIRDWLGREKQFVKKFGSADAADGGDAFTKVELKNSLV